MTSSKGVIPFGTSTLGSSSGDAAERKPDFNPFESAIREMLNVEEVKSYPQHAKRFAEFRVNCATVERTDQVWTGIVSTMMKIHKEMHPEEY